MFGFGRAPEYLPNLFNEFTASERFGSAAIENTYLTALEKWKGNVYCLTDIAVVLTQKLWDYYLGERMTDDLFALYSRLFEQHFDYVKQHLNREDYHYFCTVISWT